MRVVLASVAAILLIALAWFYLRGNVDPVNYTSPADIESVSDSLPATPGGSQGDIRAEPTITTDVAQLSVNIDPSDVDWRPLELDEPLPQDYPSLLVLAEGGNARAAWVIYFAYGSCRGAPPPQTPEEIEAAISLIDQTHQYPEFLDGKPIKPRDLNGDDPESIRTAKEAYLRGVDLCNDLSIEERIKASEWLKFAAENGGGHLAEISYASASGPEAEEAAILKYWQSGNARHALVYLANHYESQFRSGHDPEGHIKFVGVRLLTIALAGELAEFTGQPNPLTPEFIEFLTRVDGVPLHDHELRAAYEFANRLLDENPNCCLYSPQGR